MSSAICRSRSARSLGLSGVSSAFSSSLTICRTGRASSSLPSRLRKALPSRAMQVRWIFVFSSACGSRARARHGAAIDLEPLGEERAVGRRGRSRCARARSSPAPQAEAAVRDGLAGVLVGVRRREDRRRSSSAIARENGLLSSASDDRQRAVDCGRHLRDRRAARMRSSRPARARCRRRSTAPGGADAVGDERDAVTRRSRGGRSSRARCGRS